MKIEHIAVWSKDIAVLKDFYVQYFGAKANDRYVNEDKGFQSYFLSFGGGCRIELMQKTGIAQGSDDRNAVYGYAHMAFSVGGVQEVIALTERLEADGYTIASRPRYTGDGYFESAAYDPDGNLVEITLD